MGKIAIPTIDTVARMRRPSAGLGTIWEGCWHEFKVRSEPSSSLVSPQPLIPSSLPLSLSTHLKLTRRRAVVSVKCRGGGKEGGGGRILCTNAWERRSGVPDLNAF